MDLINNKYIEVFNEGKIAVIKFRERIFEFIVSLDESDTLIDYISKTQYDNNIKALLFVNEPGSIDDMQYDNFLKSILTEEYLMEEEGMPNFCEKNVRFKEINILNKIVREIVNYNKLCFVGIQGKVVTPFLGASMAADIRYATKNTVFIMAHNKYGLHPSGGLPFFLTQSLGHQKSMEIQLSERINASEALKLGIINKLLPENDFINNCIREISKFISIKSCTIRNTKRLTNFSRTLINDYFEFEAGLLNL
jgi:enoyl-CoA hydratase/carnithine racemase